MPYIEKLKLHKKIEYSMIKPFIKIIYTEFNGFYNFIH